ncbi:MAG: nicotinamide riboside transporter PnuC [Paraprevotella sp.]|nr:nicotinamide riboside transporter PnuC [Paraprevotella sp.]
MEEFVNTLDITATIVGLVYIWLEYKASIYLWMVGIIMPLIDIFLYYEAGLYADFGMAIYYALAATYGYVVWKFGKRNYQGTKEELPITHFKQSQILPAILAFLVIWLIIYEILVLFTNSDVPITDSFANALSFIGLWALARKYLEQWIIWIIVDIVLSALYIYKGIPFKAGLYALYVIIAIAGYHKWKKMIYEKQ